MGLRRHDLIAGGLALLAAGAVAAAAWGAVAEAGRTRQLVRSLARKEREARRAERLAVAAAAGGEGGKLAAAEGRLALLEGGLCPRRQIEAAAPASQAEAFFELAEFVRSRRELAERAGVAIRSDEAFGFSAYAHEGPAPGQIAGVARQKRMLGAILDALFATGPQELVAVQRLPPEGASAPAGDPRPGGASQAGDLFAIERRRSAAEPGIVRTEAFRLTFLGRTAALRRFLNSMASGELPVSVRQVTAQAAKQPAAAGRKGEPLALIARPVPSRFSVVLEWCEPAGNGSQAAAASEQPPSQAVAWREPGAQAHGPGWAYGLFTPPSIYLDRRTGELTAAPAPESEGAGGDSQSGDLALLAVGRELYRVQLVGYAGGPGGWRGIFARADTGEIIIGGEGERLGSTGLTLRRLGFDGDAGAVATVAEDEGGGEVVLTTRAPCRLGAPYGVFEGGAEPRLRWELRAGQSVVWQGRRYCVEQVACNPPRATVACLAPGGAAPVIRTLVVRAAAGGEAPRPFSKQSP